MVGYKLPDGIGDVYGVLGLKNPSLNVDTGEVVNEHSDKDIRTAYRRQALALHPDKNPDDPEADEKFNRLQIVFEWLSVSENKSAYDEEFLSRDRRKVKARQQSLEKQRLAAELRRREKEAKEQGPKQTVEYLRGHFPSKAGRGPATYDFSDARREQLVKNAELNKELLIQQEKAKTAARDARSVPVKEVDENYFYILRIHWDPYERGMLDKSETVLRELLQGFKPWTLAKLSDREGHAQLQFLSSDKAMNAAMHLALLEGDDLTIRRLNLRSGMVFSARLIKKQRRSTVSNTMVDNDPLDDEEIEQLLKARQEALNRKDQARKRETMLHHLIEGDEGLGQDSDASNLIPRTAPTLPSRTVPNTILNRLRKNFSGETRKGPSVTQPTIPTASPVSAPPIPIDLDENDSEDIESETLALLEKAANAKKKLRLS